MHSASTAYATDDFEVAIRIGSTADIDVLADIDVDAARLFAQAGLRSSTEGSEAFGLTQRTQWLRCLSAGTVLVATTPSGACLGFAVYENMGGHPYLAQLSVRLRSMRRGIGTRLLNATGNRIKNAGGHALWLITYNHLRWNRPFYERNGFGIVPPDRCGTEIAQALYYQRCWLPVPEERVVMCKDFMPAGTH